MKKFITSTVTLFMIMSHLFAATYYIDPENGDNSLAGTSTATAWLCPPGTRNIADTADLTNSYGGVFTTSAKVPLGTIFYVKGGTTWSTNKGGRWNFTSSWYDNATTNSPTKFIIDTNWQQGPVLYSAFGMTAGIAGVLIQRDSIYWDGTALPGFIFANCSVSGVQVKEQAGTSASILGVRFDSCSFSNNGYSGFSDTSGSGLSELLIRRATGVYLNNLFIDGNTNWHSGIILGESGMGVTNAIVTNCVAYRLRGDTGTNDSGVGFKAFNSDIRWLNCRATNNLKGFDLGEQTGNGSNIFYRVINCAAVSNIWGINFSGSDATRAGTMTNMILNTLILSNYYIGNNIYAGPHTCLIVNNTFAYNGSSSNFNSSNIRMNNDNNERQLLRVILRNNIFYTPLGRGNFNNHNYVQDTDSDGLTIDSDYNAWIRRSNENFGYWAGAEATADNQTYTYGVNGPGHASGNWYNFYSYSTTAPTNGATGHFHCDAHSYATSGDNTNLPPMAANYTLTNAYPGEIISTNSWFLPEMAFDRNGVARINYDVGAYEFAPSGVTKQAVIGKGAQSSTIGN